MDAESRTDEGQAGRGSPVQVGLERWVVGPEISGICRGGKDNIDLEMGEVAVVPLLVWYGYFRLFLHPLAAPVHLENMKQSTMLLTS